MKEGEGEGASVRLAAKGGGRGTPGRPAAGKGGGGVHLGAVPLPLLLSGEHIGPNF